MEGNQEYKLLGLKERSSKDVVYRTGNTVNILIITLYVVYSIKTLNYVVHLELTEVYTSIFKIPFNGT